MTHKFLESISSIDCKYQNLPLHQERINRTFDRFFKEIDSFDLASVLPKINLEGTYKVRIIYSSESQDVEFIEYKKRDIQTLEVIDPKPFDYSFKFENRSKIDQLVKLSDADDIIISFNGEIKDSSYANLAFWDGSEWLTPAKPLLEGVKRAQLLSEGKIKKVLIQTSDLKSFEKVSLINAMLDLGEVEIDIKDLRGL